MATFISKLQTLVERRAPRLAVLWRCRHLIRHSSSYLLQTGYLRSLEKNLPVDAQGKPLAYLNYPILALLEERLKPDHRVLEFGSGFSTVFWSSRVKEVVAVEHEEQWLQRVKEMIPASSNVRILLVPLGDNYPRAASQAVGEFQIILIDGRMRVDCARHCLPRLASDGVILWDDSSRPRYQEGIAELEQKGFRKLRLQGLKPAGLGVDETTIFYRDGNCLGL
ncbi:methyltransferase family protein [Roseimicrobium gellanilyticum]|uniref:Methyltransferase family protein n=1 Tax=Roseimicrobium gellanilyticum TaxID=748857 RepID=A0A366HX18_9BACT|nr:class I SAM-dependent methyltransferase [Roseimicrobium gellanilyticum]RBP48114.1 methyltransferase family protein [Roseimicrobium gellanilyticum]